MHTQCRLILCQEIKAQVHFRIDDLEAYILEAEQMQPGKVSGNGLQGVALSGITDIEAATAEHGDFEGDFLCQLP